MLSGAPAQAIAMSDSLGGARSEASAGAPTHPPGSTEGDGAHAAPLVYLGGIAGTLASAAAMEGKDQESAVALPAAFVAAVAEVTAMQEDPTLPMGGGGCCERFCLLGAAARDANALRKVLADARKWNEKIAAGGRGGPVSMGSVEGVAQRPKGGVTMTSSAGGASGLHGLRKSRALVDMYGQRSAAMEEKRREFWNKNGRALLDAPNHFCRQALLKTLAISDYQLRSPAPRGGAALIDELDCRRRRRRGTRDERELLVLDKPLECCVSNCWNSVPVDTKAHWDAVWTACEGRTTSETAVLLDLLWDSACGRATTLCNTYVVALVGTSVGRINALRGVLREHGGLVQDAPALQHGNIGKEPANKTPADVVAKLERALQLYTRQNPSDNLLVCTDPNYQGPAGLLQALAEECPEAADLATSTLKRVIQAYLEKKGIRGIIKEEADHNVCKVRERDM